MTELQKEQKILLSLLQYAIHERKKDLPKDLTEQEIPLLLKEAKVQAVRDMALSGNTSVTYILSKLVRLLEKHGFSYVILKGDATSTYYPEPELRMHRGGDFLIDPAQKKQVEQALLDMGYTHSQEGHICHVVIKKPGEHLEIHFEPAGSHNGKIGHEVRECLKDTLKSSERHTIRLESFRCPMRSATDLSCFCICSIISSEKGSGRGTYATEPASCRKHPNSPSGRKLCSHFSKEFAFLLLPR